ncbi:S8 family serine peptidase, partial [candidate division KSB1 bacterium]|nr:S8 family serine peptidase [candidate division KSB1 bacterium]
MTFRLKSALSLYFLLYSITISGTPADSYDKLDPALRKQVMTRWAEKATTVNNLSDEYYKILIETIDGFDFHQFDFELRPVQDYFGVARLTCPQIEELAVNPDILKISLAGKNRMTLDESLPMISADRIHNGDLGRTYKGSGVIIGIYDSGIDWHHPDFIDPNTGQTRILMIWDQTISTGSPPSNFGNGTLFTQNQIQAELDGSNSGIVQSFDFWGHGTHIAGIAGGNGGLSSTYMGMAPFTEFIIVKGSDYGEVSDDQVIDGVDFTLQQAQILGRPVVINLSLGKQQGPHDGTSLFERIIDGFLWDPGRSIVVAAGNEGDESIHISIDFDNESPDESIAVQFTVPENQINHPDYMLLEGWYAPGSDFEITLEMPSGQMVGPASRGSIVRWPDVVHPVVYIDNANGGVDSQNGDRRIYISLFDVQSNEG